MKFLTLSFQFLIFATLLFCGGAFGSVVPVHAQDAAPTEISMKSVEVEYTLPHAGILPDNPLYPIKRTRDAFWLFLTRDSGKKAELLLLFADKKMVMAQALAEKGKWQLAMETVGAAQKDVEKLLEAVDLSHKIGSSPSRDFLDTVILSNEKHLQQLEDMLKTAPNGVRADLEELMKTNITHYNEMQKL